MTTKVTTDWHIGVKRLGGTTLESQQALMQYLRDSLQAQLDDCDHLIAGDLLDCFTIDTSELIATYNIFSSWLSKYQRKLAIMRGNHDFHMSALKMSSFDLLAHILKYQFPEQVTVANDVTKWKQFILVPHLPNNDILLDAIQNLQDIEGHVIVFHANVDNIHAAESEHSLNISIEQIKDLVSRGNSVLVGHEHKSRSLLGGKCIVIGNTAPSSISDCIGDPFKNAIRVEGNHIEVVPTWDHLDSYVEVDWRDLDDIGQWQFIRVTGTASAQEAADVIKAVSKLRQSSQAFVIGNAVKVAGSELVNSVESIKAFDVLGAIYAELNDEEKECVKGLLC